MCIIDCGLHSASQSPYLYTFKEPRNRFHGIDSASLCNLAVGIDSWAPLKVYKVGLCRHRLAETIPRKRFLGFLNVYKIGLGFQTIWSL